MKRLHVHVSVADLQQSIRFYSTLFATAPSVVKPDYAKWMLEDPRVNFAISMRDRPTTGVDHLGIQVENETELAEVYDRLKTAEGPTLEQRGTTCCYAASDKTWILDPQGVSWETFLTHGEATVYGDGAFRAEMARVQGACCDKPDLQPAATAACCEPAAAAPAKACCP
ncbi:MAG: VOC family protein [Alphaproteobacteria bacterium]|nr:VOC family protein [Alphaproteobacteria bacterium]